MNINSTVNPSEKIPKYLVECTGASEDDVRIFHLHDALAETYEVRSDADGSARHETHCYNVVVCM